MEIRRRGVERDSKKHSRAVSRALPVFPARVVDRVGGGKEREQLLREHLLQFLGRDSKSVEGNGQRVEMKAVFECVGRRFAAEEEFLDSAFSAERAEMSPDPDDRDRDRRGIGDLFRVQVLRLFDRAGHPFFDQRMSVDPAETEPAQGRATGYSLRTTIPGLGGFQDSERAAFIFEFRARCLEVRGRR